MDIKGLTVNRKVGVDVDVTSKRSDISPLPQEYLKNLKTMTTTDLVNYLRHFESNAAAESINSQGLVGADMKCEVHAIANQLHISKNEAVEVVDLLTIAKRFSEPRSNG
jgi:hypothetical protein